MAVDPVTLTVIASGLDQVCNEMDIAIEQAAFCPIVSEARDRASGLYRASDGEMISQGATGLPIFVGTMQFGVRACIGAFDSIEEGDVIVTNDPYLSGTHLMDLKVVTPCFHDGEIVAFLADTAHWSDIGGSSPGGFNPAARNVIEEGLRIPPVLLYRRGELNQPLLDTVLANVRVADERIGDLKAQIAALGIGRRRLEALFERYGADEVTESMQLLGDRSEQQMRAHIGRVPDGVYRFETELDDDGISFEPLRIKLELRVEGDGMTFDFTGSSPTTAGPFNSAFVSTASAVYLAMAHVFPETRMSGGCFRPLEVVAPKDTFLNASYPSAVSGCSTEVTMRIVDAVFGALADVLPERVTAACFGSICCFTIAGRDPRGDREYVLFNFSGGGYGGSVRGDGLTNGCAPISIARTTPIEIIEAYYPVAFEKYGLHDGSAGPGRARGGYGIDLRVRLLRGSATANVLADRGRHVPFGIAGGHDAAGTLVELEVDGEWFEPEHGTKVRDVALAEGDRLRICSPGGGGFGPPDERDLEAVARDVEQQLLDAGEAQRVYGLPAPQTTVGVAGD